MYGYGYRYGAGRRGLLPPGRQGGGPVYDPDALALFDRFTTPATDDRKAIINQLYVDCAAAGIPLNASGPLDGLYIRAQHDAQAARQNLVANQFNTTAVSSPVFTADRGYAGNGSSSYLNNNFNPATVPGAKFVRDSAYMAMYINTVADAGAAKYGIGTLASAIKPRNATTTAALRINTGGVERVISVGSTTVGWISWGRTGPGNVEGVDFYIDRDGSVVTSSGASSPSAALPSDEFFELARSGSGVAGGFLDARSAAVAFGGYLTPSQDAALHAAILKFLTSVGGN